MKTVFKEGMEVYDQLNFPNKKGVIVEISNEENDPYPVEVSFENEAGRNNYTPDGRFSKKHIPTLSTKPYEIVLEGFEQKGPAPTFEEAEDWVKREFAKGNIFLISKDALEALRQLVILRDYYNEGWLPDWEDDKNKFCISVEKGKLCLELWLNTSRVLAFKSHEIAYNFLEEQKELLEKAKPLL